MTRGFTIVELMVSIGIFIIMTSLVVAKYGTFNQSTLLTDTAYDIALAMRTAQTYGLSVKNIGALGGTANYSSPYGIDFSTAPAPGSATCPGGASNASVMVLFANTYTSTDSAAGAAAYDSLSPNCDTPVSLYALSRGATIDKICAGAQFYCTDFGLTQLDVVFRRPNPDAFLCFNGNCALQCTGAIPCTYAKVTLKAVDGSTREITIRKNGQMSVDQ
jgi:type II secretory pathway pseudopilin PulG